MLKMSPLPQRKPESQVRADGDAGLVFTPRCLQEVGGGGQGSKIIVDRGDTRSMKEALQWHARRAIHTRTRPMTLEKRRSQQQLD